MILTRKKGLILPSRFKQRGNFSAFPAGSFAILGSVVPNVTDMELIHNVATGQARSGISFNESTVGSVTSLVQVIGIAGPNAVLGLDDQGVPVDHTGEWTTETVTPSEWEVACISEDSGTWDVAFAAVGVYTSFATADMAWYEFRVGGKLYTPGTDTVTATFRIREVADTANFVDFEVIATAIQT